MARSSLPLPEEPANVDAINLARALSRLEPKITQDGAARLRRSAIERAKTATNLEYARTLLLRREHATSQLKIPAKKKQQQATLSQQRALLRRLTERLAELSHAAGSAGTVDDSNGDNDDSGNADSDLEDGEDILLQLTPTPTQPTVPASPSTPSEPSSPINSSTTTMSAAPAATPTPMPAHGPDAGALRSRNPREELLGQASAATTTSSDAHASLPPPTIRSSDGMSKETADVLGAADSEHSQLTTAMLGLAAALKQSAQTFAKDLDADQGTVRNTEAALDKNKEGMQRTSGGLARLRKMSEGKWWVTRIGMMVLIPVLWVVLLLEVFVMPKIRL